METSHCSSTSCVPSKPSQTSYKQSARAQARARAARQGANLKTMPPSPRRYTGDPTSRQTVVFATEAFRSPRVLEEIAQVEKKHIISAQHKSSMTPDEAITKLRQAVHSTQGGSSALQKMLAGLEAACWQPFTSDQSDANGDQHKYPNREDTKMQSPRVLYSQALRGVEEMLLEEQDACEELREEIQHVEKRNNDLPQQIHEYQADMARAVQSAVYGSTASERRNSIANVSSVTEETAVNATTESIREEIALMRRRKELRTWACSELRTALNDLMTRRSELKQLVSSATSDVKKEEQANKLRAKRLEDLRILSTSASMLPAGRMGSKASAQQQLARLTMAIARNQGLQDTQSEHKALVKARTEAIFVVRNQLRELNDQRATVEKALSDIQDEATHMKRAYTPRPDWSELHDATVVTTAVDRADPTARMRMGATRNKLTGSKSGDADEGRASEQRLMQILSSNWSTVTKVSAMATELEQIRSRDHAGDTILAEQKKLKHLHKEIGRIVQQLETIKALSGT